MKSKLCLFIICLNIFVVINPIYAAIPKTSPVEKSPIREKNIESSLRQSGLCKHYPVVVKIVEDKKAVIATYADRRLPDKETKLLALNMAKLVCSASDTLNDIQVRFYDPASTKYWKDIAVNKAQIEVGLNSSSEQDKALAAIKISDNFGLVDGPNLETRISLYKRIQKLQRAGIDVDSLLAKFKNVEEAAKEKKDINAQLGALDAAILEAEPTLKPIESSEKSTDTEASLQQSLQDAVAQENAALQTVQEKEQERNDMDIPEAYDLDSQERYNDRSENIQKEVDTALANLQAARSYRESIYQQLMAAKERN